MHFAAALLEFGVQGFDSFYGKPDHGLVSDRAGKFFVSHASDVQVGLAAVDSCIVWWRGITKSFGEATNFCPPSEGFRCVCGGKYGDRAFYDRVHGRSITELSPIAYTGESAVSYTTAIYSRLGCTSSHTNDQNTAKQMIVSHHGVNGIGNKMMSNHLSRPQPFREGSSPGRALRAASPGDAISVEGNKFRAGEGNACLRVTSNGRLSWVSRTWI
jgi:hypothetical protein